MSVHTPPNGSSPKARFASALKAARKAKGLSVVAFAEAVGVSRISVHAWENAESATYPQGDRWPVIEQVLGVGERELRFGDVAPSAPAPGGSYPRHVEALIKRFEADLEEAPISDTLRMSLVAVVRDPAQVALYRDRFGHGVHTAEEQRTRMEAHLAQLRRLIDGIVADQATPMAAIPLDEEGELVPESRHDAQRRGDRVG